LKPFEIRELRGHAEYAACVQLQKETWGEHFTELVPAAILQVAQKVGGIAAGAFDGGELIGLVFGISGIRDGQPVHWSDMLAVRSSYRNRGIGEQLKWYQCDLLLERGINRVYWTFDPLDAKNAHINLQRLGVIAREYVVDMYGQTGSVLHTGIGTDRLVVTWELTSDRVRTRRAGRTPRQQSVDAQIEIPLDIHALNRSDPAAAASWREKTREQFLKYLPDYVVTGLVLGGETASYALTSASNLSA
jgi:predicted GNAT superfamily acetyltransferase